MAIIITTINKRGKGRTIMIGADKPYHIIAAAAKTADFAIEDASKKLGQARNLIKGTFLFALNSMEAEKEQNE